VLRAAEALVRQEYSPERFEIIICCDRCTDGTEESLRSAFGHRLRVVKADAAGQAGALNTGLKHARGWLAIMLDDELEAEKGFVAAHVHAHLSEATAKIAVTGYSPVTIDANSAAYVRMMARDYENYFLEFAKTGRKGKPTDLCGANFSLSLSALRAVGGFKQGCLRNDFELALRLLELGYEIRFCRGAQANQHVAITADVVIGRTAQRAQNDCQMALDYPWCVPYLPFYRILTDPSVRRRWRVLWETSRPAASLFGAARRVFPASVRLANLEYAARYCMGLRQEIGSWDKFRRLAATN
jgi:GT2 family glycosyltransferase